MTGTGTLAVARMGLREQSRRPLLVISLVVLPVWFVARAITVTEPIPRIIGLPGGETVATTMRGIHGADMALIAIGFVSALSGVFLILSARSADRRLVVAGLRPADVLTGRLIVLACATLLVVLVSLAVTAWKSDVATWWLFAAAALSAGFIYGGLGALAGALLGRVAAVYLMLFLPMIDLGIAQNPMFGDGTADGWAVALPGWAPTRLAMSAAFTTDFSGSTEVAVASVWLLGLLALIALLLRRSFATPG